MNDAEVGSAFLGLWVCGIVELWVCGIGMA
jgi:hypothetical protein